MPSVVQSAAAAEVTTASSAAALGWIPRLAIFALLMIPSAHFAWSNRDMPDFARLHDDGLLFSSARSLGSGAGYRIPSLPENPYQTKYPPLYPALLSVIWKVNPE